MIDWRISGSFMEICQDGQWVQISEAFGISTVKVDLITGDHELEFFVESATGGRNSGTMKRSCVDRRSIMKVLYDKGLSFSDKDEAIDIVQEIFLGSETLASTEMQHRQLGFAEVDGQRAFLLDRPIGLTDPKRAASRYVVPEIMLPRGELENWLAVIKDEVLGHPTLELALAIGVVAPVAHLLREAHAIMDLPIVAFIGQSSSGKTTAMRISASVWGYPAESVGIIDDLNATQNAFFQSLARNVGVPTFVDETSAKPSWDFNEMLYFLPKGRDKKRCDASGQIRSTAFFSGAVIFTGERSLLKMAEENSGLHARILELTMERWTEDAEHAERITDGCCQYYGTAAPVLAKWLLTISKETLIKVFQGERQKLRDQIDGVTGIEGRILKICAMILTAAWTIEQSLGLTLDIEMMRSLLCQQVSTKRLEDDWPTRVYRNLMEQISENGSKFAWPSKKTTDHPSGKDVLGLFGYREGVPCVWIGRERFKLMLENAKVQDLSEITKPLCDKGWLVDHGNRHYFTNYTINGVREKACCILLTEQPSLFKRLEGLPAKASDCDLVRALRGKTFEAGVWSGQADCDREVRDALESEEERFVFGLVKPCAQGEAVIINNALSKALCVRDKIFMTILFDERVLLLTQQPIDKASIKMHFNDFNKLKLNTNRRIYKAICEAVKLNLTVGEGIVFSEIIVEKYKGLPAAAVGIDWRNSCGVLRGIVTGWELPKSDDEDIDRARRKELLLVDDEEEAD